jgi:hypothetical protein
MGWKWRKIKNINPRRKSWNILKTENIKHIGKYEIYIKTSLKTQKEGAWKIKAKMTGYY